jgi:deazaflavin-dependent oxidoreductase (nitroreductase family)
VAGIRGSPDVRRTSRCQHPAHERDDQTKASSEIVKRRVITFVQKHLLNPRALRHAGELGSRGATLETTGRKSGLPRQVPVNDGLQGQVFWIAAHHGRSAAWVRNLEANPRVRVKVHGRRRTGHATEMPDDDPLERLGSIDPHIADRARKLGTAPLTIRVDLDGEEA